MWTPDLADPVCANEQRTQSHGGNNPRARNVVAYGIRSDASREGAAKTAGPDAAGSVRLRDPGMGVSEELAPTLDAARPHAVAFGETSGTIDAQSRMAGRVESTHVGVDLQNGAVRAPGEAGTLCAAQDRGNRAEAVMSGLSVRRLTPLECERLQGLPDYWTWVPYPPAKPKARVTRLAKDSPRYKAIGNGIALPCLAWIAERLTIVDGLLAESGNRSAGRRPLTRAGPRE